MTSPIHSPQSFPSRPSVSSGSQLSTLGSQLGTPRAARLIAFAGAAGAGKTTAAEILVAQDPERTKRLSFADPLRAMFKALGLTDADLSTGKNLPHPLLGSKTPREAMQTLGTEWGRQMISDSLWRDATAARIKHFTSLGCRVVIDDVRFDNEADLIHEMGGIVIHLTHVGGAVLAPAHRSEQGIHPEKIDYAIRARGVGFLTSSLAALPL